MSSNDDKVTAAELRALAREYVTIVQPGEVLIVREPSHWKPREVGDLNDALNAICSDPDAGLGIKVLVVPGDGVSIAVPQPGHTLSTPAVPDPPVWPGRLPDQASLPSRSWAWTR